MEKLDLAVLHRLEQCNLLISWEAFAKFLGLLEWGYLQNAAPKGVPSLLSRHIDLDYTHQICKQAFPDGKLTSQSYRLFPYCNSSLLSGDLQKCRPGQTPPSSTSTVHTN